ncbi:precorrin-6Y C5,15-methyltransferase (decarboxylating) [Jatrophihabitans sp. GAS493]|nr:precorrin-6Y C5,15-methyltransferase (decarboxylating) [Jatrophihabitans sp. GAS493]
MIGIGEDGWDGLSAASQRLIRDADVVVGSDRQQALIAGHARSSELWPSPMTQALAGLRDRHPGERIVVLASGDPMFYGVGASLARLFGPDALDIRPFPSSVSLACARLGWPQADVDVVSAVGRPLSAVTRLLQPGRRVLVLVGDQNAAAELVELLLRNGLGGSRVHVLEHLGGPAERQREGIASQWAGNPHAKLAIIALECKQSDDADNSAGAPLALTPGLPDDAWSSDGVLTKREVRAVTLALLAPMPGQLLWDVGAGSGSIAVEWMRSHHTCRGIAVEVRDDRRAYISANMERFGVPALQIVAGQAPQALDGLPAPDAIFIGGGVTNDGVVKTCLEALKSGGRLVANGVTIETETELAVWQQRVGGELSRITVSHAAAIGSFTAFRPALTVTQWSYIK